MHHHNDTKIAVIVDEVADGRDIPTRGPVPAAVVSGTDAGRAFWDDWDRDRAETQAIIDEMNRRTSRELLKRAIAAAMRKRAA